jgi:hypothetical protein
MIDPTKPPEERQRLLELEMQGLDLAANRRIIGIARQRAGGPRYKRHLRFKPQR